jgi:carboxymethylenebutenolidase
MGQMIELTATDQHKFAAYSAGPADACAGLVVVQEIFGVNSHMRNVADRFAAEGYRVIAPALFDRVQRGVDLGYQAQDVEIGKNLRAKVAAQDTLMDLIASAEALGPIKKGIIGYCWGGSLAWIGATQTDLFSAASGWYGGMIVQTKNATPRCPVQLHFGETDGSIPLADVEQIRQAQPGVAIYTYPAGHGFGCDDRAAYEPHSAALAQSRTLAFFSEHLGV